MKNVLKCGIAVAWLWLSALVPAVAQSTPNLINGQVPTAGQWNSYFAAKQDALGYIPLNTAGGVMSGRLITAAPGASLAGLNLAPGTAPGSPANGDLWATSVGLFVQINGVTVGPLASTVGPIFTGQIITQGLTTTQPGWYVQLVGDTTPRVRLGLNSADVASLAFGPGNAVRDSFIERMGAGALRFGTVDAASPVAQTLSVQNVAAGTSNTAGAALSIAGSQGTGTGIGGGIIFKTAPAGSSGTAQNALSTALSIFGDGGLSTGAATDQGAGTLNLAGSLFNNGTAPTGTGAYVRATAPSIAGATLSGTITYSGQSPGTCASSILINASNQVITGACPGSAASIQQGVTTVTSSTGSNRLHTSGTVSAGTGLFTETPATADSSGNLAAVNSLAGGVIATKAQQIAGSSAVNVVTPSVQQNHPSAVKAWFTIGTQCTTGTCTLADSYGITSVVHSATGDYTVTFSTAFANAGYTFGGSCQAAGTANGQCVVNIKASTQSGAPTLKSTTQIEVLTANGSVGTPIDNGNWSMTFTGTQ